RVVMSMTATLKHDVDVRGIGDLPHVHVCGDPASERLKGVGVTGATAAADPVRWHGAGGRRGARPAEGGPRKRAEKWVELAGFEPATFSLRTGPDRLRP